MTESDATFDTDTAAAAADRGHSSPKRRRIVVAIAWVAAAGGWLLYLHAADKGAVDTLQAVVDTLRGASWALPAFVAIYAARPLILFPASLLTIAGGIIFGPVVGILVTIVASNLSAMVAYYVGRSLGSAPTDTDDDSTFVARWSKKMRERSFLTVMVMRLAYLPYDLVNYLAGFLRIAPGAFLAATAIGSLPGTVSFVLAGSSIDRIDEGVSGFDLRIFVVSAILFVVSLTVAKVLQRRDVVEKVV